MSNADLLSDAQARQTVSVAGKWQPPSNVCMTGLAAAAACRPTSLSNAGRFA